MTPGDLGSKPPDIVARKPYFRTGPGSDYSRVVTIERHWSGALDLSSHREKIVSLQYRGRPLLKKILTDKTALFGTSLELTPLHRTNKSPRMEYPSNKTSAPRQLLESGQLHLVYNTHPMFVYRGSAQSQSSGKSLQSILSERGLTKACTRCSAQSGGIVRSGIGLPLSYHFCSIMNSV